MPAVARIFWNPSAELGDPFASGPCPLISAAARVEAAVVFEPNPRFFKRLAIVLCTIWFGF